MGFARPRRTDAGTILWHWLLVVCLAIATLTGLRIAADEPQLRWLMHLDAILPKENLWFWHIVGALCFTAAFVAYGTYVVLARLTQRARLDGPRLVTIGRSGSARWASLGVVVLWIGFGAFAVEIASGLLLYLGQADIALVLHRNTVWVCLAFPLLHVLLHFAYGGVPQLLRIVRPARLVPGPSEPDVLSLLAEHIQLVDELRRGVASPPAAIVAPQDRPGLPPLRSSALAGILVLACGFLLDRTTTLTLVAPQVGELGAMERPSIDGDTSDPIWVSAPPVTVMTEDGSGFGGSGQSRVEIRAAHDLESIYIAITWDDPTRSLKHRPLIKQADGWHLVTTDPIPAREETFNEDQFSILVAHPTIPLIGAAIHLSARPLPDAPPSATGRGLHYTAAGGLADVWVWRASHGGMDGYVVDAHFSEPIEPTPAQTAGTDRYMGGFALDGGDECYGDNLQSQDGLVVVPARLPSDLDRTTQELGEVYDTGDLSEEEGTDWALSLAESTPYSAAADAAVPVGTVVPGVIVSCLPAGDVADVRGAARWSAGRWTLELVRPLNTNSPQDVPIVSGDMLWVAAFDHAATRHTHHVRPLTLELQ